MSAERVRRILMTRRRNSYHPPGTFSFGLASPSADGPRIALPVDVVSFVRGLDMPLADSGDLLKKQG